MQNLSTIELLFGVLAVWALVMLLALLAHEIMDWLNDRDGPQ